MRLLKNYWVFKKGKKVVFWRLNPFGILDMNLGK